MFSGSSTTSVKQSFSTKSVVPIICDLKSTHSSHCPLFSENIISFPCPNVSRTLRACNPLVHSSSNAKIIAILYVDSGFKFQVSGFKFQGARACGSRKVDLCVGGSTFRFQVSILNFQFSIFKCSFDVASM